MLIPLWVTVAFWVLALVGSLFYGWKAIKVFGPEEDRDWSWRAHQVWFNAAGSVVGWTAGWFAVRKVWLCLAATPPLDFGWSDAALIAVAFVAITGYLPYATAGVLKGLQALASKVTGLKE